MDARAILDHLAESGLLLLTDPRLPSVTALVAGEPVRGSWWSHPRGRKIYAVCEALGEHPDVAVVKLVAGKVTFVHRRLWAALHALATSREPWQTRGLSAPAAALWRSTEREGEQLLAELPGDRRAQSRLADEIEGRLCVHGYQVHTEKGSHARVLESWAHWVRRKHWRPSRLSSDEARAQFGAAVEAWPGTAVRFPWSAASTASNKKDRSSLTTPPRAAKRRTRRR